MSAIFHVLFRGEYCQFTFTPGGQRHVKFVCRAQASVFVTEADAWQTAQQHHLHPTYTAVASGADVTAKNTANTEEAA